MEMNLKPQKADTTIFEGEGGGYYAWTAANTPVVVEAAIGAGRLVLQPQGFALPHYADANKIGYVIQGSCTVGLILPERPEEKVLIIEKGDAILCPTGSVTWWFNGGDSDVTIIFLGETSQSYTPGLFDYFFLTGALGILRGFSTEFIAKAYDLNHEQSKHLVESQANALVVKIDADIVSRLPHKCNCKKEEYVVNLDTDTESETDTERVGLSPKLVRLEAEAVLDPYYSTAHQVMYVTKGGGRIQIVGLNGARVLDEVVEEGHLIVVPKFFVAALMASDKGMECLCVSTSPRPLTKKIGGNKSAYKALSSSVLEVALNVSPEFVKNIKS
ncbi:cocosin 1-like [Salvia hispanica]|uniref:cocosin 1-like n=1 Tax=Salvia hispanica TaxID=49212 RepID=UPI00200973A4|nr:cocosin 1-like [Salvia hispanica]